jgi:hypothetical protein
MGGGGGLAKTRRGWEEVLVEAFSSMMSSASMPVLVEAQKEGKRTCSPLEDKPR